MLPMTDKAPKFKSGDIFSTPGALDALDGEALAGVLTRHLEGDWGDLGALDAQANEDALKHGDRLFSAYNVGDEKVWVITEADRSSTTVLLPDEY